MQEINLQESQKEFLRFLSKFDLTNTNLERKQYHSLRVMEISEEIAEAENFSEEEVTIATLIGLLHDIARFDQYTQYRTFSDSKSFDHGDIGVEILKEDNYIRKYIAEDKYDRIIFRSIKNHNKFKIEEDLTKEENKFCKLIRDADKIDILWEGTELFWKGEENQIANSEIAPEIIKEFNKHKTIDRRNIKQHDRDGINKIIPVMALIFDINYKSSFRKIKQEQYIDKILARFKFVKEDTKKQIEEIQKILNQYIEDKAN